MFGGSILWRAALFGGFSAEPVVVAGNLHMVIWGEKQGVAGFYCVKPGVPARSPRSANRQGGGAEGDVFDGQPLGGHLLDQPGLERPYSNSRLTRRHLSISAMASGGKRPSFSMTWALGMVMIVSALTMLSLSRPASLAMALPA